MPAEGRDRVTAASEAVNAALKSLKPEERQRVLNSAYILWGVGPSPSGLEPGPAAGATQLSAGAVVPGGAAPHPKDFMVQKIPKTDVERMACLAYYLTHYRNTTKFKTQDLERLNSDARQPRLSNASAAADNATKGKAQYLSQAGGGYKQITPRGEALVEALPDRDKVKKALEQYPLARRFPRKKSRAKRAT